MSAWRKAENEHGFTYYINEQTKAIQWDHPEYSQLKQAIDDNNYIVYPAYRLAAKFNALQKCLYMDNIPVSIVAGVFEKHRLGNNESTLALESYDLEAVLSDIYFAANKMNNVSVNVDFATELMMCFLYNVFDRKREGNIQVFSAKIILGVLSKASLIDLYKYLFGLCRDHNNCVTRIKLRNLLFKLCEVTKYLHENENFGTHLVNDAVEECFKSSPGLVGVTESAFVSWLESSSLILSWMTILHRIRTAEAVVHSGKCSTCSTEPLWGLKYECVKCLRYTQCQKCFLAGNISRSHKLSHLVREYYSNDSNMIYSTKLVKRLCSLFCRKKTKNKVFEIVKPDSCFREKFVKASADFSEVEPLSEPESQLQSVIRQLEAQNREMQQIVILGNYSDKEMKKYLEEYRVYMARNIKRLKNLNAQLKTQADSVTPKHHDKIHSESTPMVKTGHVVRCQNIGMDYLSPIAQVPEDTEEYFSDETGCNNRVKSANDADGETFRETQTKSNIQYGMDDMSTWIGGMPQTPTNHFPVKKSTIIPKSPVKVLHNDLDDALAKLQQILANNFALEESSLGITDNAHLKTAVTEVEGMLTSIIDNVEISRCNSAQPVRLKFDSMDLVKTAV